MCVRIFEPPGSCVCVEKQNTFQLHKNSDNNNKNNLHGGGGGTILFVSKFIDKLSSSL